MGEQSQKYKWIGKRTLRPDGPDKVTGRAKFGADLALPGMLYSRVLRSPHAHANIRGIDTSKAEALPGVKAVITGADFPNPGQGKMIAFGEGQLNYSDMARNVIAREKALYDGHAVAAVAATSAAAAEEALSLIEVDYELLPHVIDVEAAMEPNAPVLHDNLFTDGVTPTPDKPSNIASRLEFNLGDVEAGFAKADAVVERKFTTQPVHQGYIEPHAVVAEATEDGQVRIWCSSQGAFMVRGNTAQTLGMDMAQIRVTPAEIGGAFGGKTVVYLEPLAVRLSQKAGRPVRMVMSREEVFRGSGPTSGSAMEVKIGATKDGKITAAQATLKFQAGAFQGSPAGPGAMCAFGPYDLENVNVVGYDVVV
ncbi:MAG: molybdopterin-dependent oxidoreductase, partial [Alphaproteobacteria bacterium]|nr:molybdopterin-dependent oxidoreductase [Alphaproteobacteria bacterium]